MEGKKMRQLLIVLIILMGLLTPAHGETDLTQEGIVFLKGQRFDAAIKAFSKTLKADPNNTKARYYRGMARYYKGDIDEAIEDYTRVISDDPNFSDVHTSRGAAFFRQGDYQRAQTDLDTALKKNPDDANAINQKAWMLAVCPQSQYRDGEKAVALAKRAINTKSTPNYLDTLAAAYAESGKYQKAAETQRKVISMLTQDETFDRLDMYLQRLKTYQSGKPWRAGDMIMESALNKKIETTPQKIKSEKSDPQATEKITVSTKKVPDSTKLKPAPQPKPDSMKANSEQYPYTIFISTYQDPKVSAGKVLALKKNMDPVYVSHAYFKDSGHWYQIYYGWYKTISDAKKAAENLKKRHFRKAIVVEKPYAVQVGKTASKEDLNKIEKSLEALHYPSYRVADPNDPNLTRVLIGSYSTKIVPDKLLNTLKSAGFTPAVVPR